MTTERTSEVCGRTGAPTDYKEGRGLANSFTPGCAQCGSVSGDAFMEYVREGHVVHGSDKNYKAYLEKDTGTPHETEEYTYTNGDYSHTGTQAKQGTGIQHAKFYYQHLSSEQRNEFVQLWNNRTLNHMIYVMPYFMGPA